MNMREYEHWSTLWRDNDPAEWECGEPWTTEPTLGLLVESFPHDVPGWMFDLGCGTGRLAVPMAERFPDRDVLGVDITDASTVFLNRDQRLPNVYAYRTDARTWAYGTEDRCAFGWSVALFQHLDADAVQQALFQVERALCLGGVFVCQFVESGQPAEWNHPHKPADMVVWAHDAGLELIELRRGWLLPEWDWLTVRKP